jgi:hypothetical protein
MKQWGNRPILAQQEVTYPVSPGYVNYWQAG